MIPLTAASVSQPTTAPRANPITASIYAGLATAVLAVIFIFAFQSENPVFYIITLLLLGLGPILGYAFAVSDWSGIGKLIVAGIIGSIPVLAILLWPILVGALDRRQSIGSLIMGSLIGTVLGVVVWLLVATFFGQNPYAWFAPAFVLLASMWGGSLGAAMVAWEKS